MKSPSVNRSNVLPLIAMVVIFLLLWGYALSRDKTCEKCRTESEIAETEAKKACEHGGFGKPSSIIVLQNINQNKDFCGAQTFFLHCFVSCGVTYVTSAPACNRKNLQACIKIRDQEHKEADHPPKKSYLKISSDFALDEILEAVLAI